MHFQSRGKLTKCKMRISSGNFTKLPSLLASYVLHCLNRTWGPSPPQEVSHGPDQGHDWDQGQGMIYLVFMVCLFSFFTFGIMLSYIRSRKVEGSHDPYHQYIARDWSRPQVPPFLVLAHKDSVVVSNPATLEQLPG